MMKKPISKIQKKCADYSNKHMLAHENIMYKHYMSNL